jgi:hypothetical protein
LNYGTQKNQIKKRPHPIPAKLLFPKRIAKVSGEREALNSCPPLEENYGTTISEILYQFLISDIFL